jgi:hypothetical protein
MNSWTPRSRRPVTTVLIMVLAGSAVACSTDATPAATTSGPSAAEYDACLREQGLSLEQYTAEDGTTRWRPDKRRNDPAKISAAAQACRALRPGSGDATEAPTADLEANRRYAACVRAHGVPEFPDPDPRTGDFTMDDELAKRIKEHPATAAALAACRLPGSGGGVVGG